MLKQLKEKVYEANILLPKYNLVSLTWGNVSGIDRENNLVVIKPSGIEYEELTPEKMVVLDLNGNVIEGDLKPSSDTPTHLEIYKHFEDVGGVSHTHSPWAVSFAQAEIPIVAAGTTHADHFYGSVPVTRKMNKEEIINFYERETGKVIVETFRDKNINPNDVPAVLVNDHGPFTWGKCPNTAVENSLVLEQVAEMLYHTIQLNSKHLEMDEVLLDKHFLRKHGADSYYGQN